MNIPGMGNMMKKIQQMQEDMRRGEEELRAMDITGESGAGMAKVVLNGQKECIRVELDPSLLQEEKSFIEDLIAAAFNDALRNVDKAREEKMGGLTAGLQMPPGLDSFLK